MSKKRKEITREITPENEQKVRAAYRSRESKLRKELDVCQVALNVACESVKKLEAEKAEDKRALEGVKNKLAENTHMEALVPYCLELVTGDDKRQVQMRVKNESLIDMIYRVLLRGQLGSEFDRSMITWDRIEIRLVNPN